jgi:replicative DNA helicase
VVLDPLSRFAGCDTEKDNAAATRFIEAAETLVDVPGGPTVLLAHHTTKSSRSNENSEGASTNAARGASALTDGVRWVAHLDSKEDTAAEFTVTKSNYSLKGKPLRLVRDDGGALRAETAKERAERAASSGDTNKKANGAAATVSSLETFKAT